MDIQALLSKMTLKEKVGQLVQLNASFFRKNNEAAITGPAAKLNITPADVANAGSTLTFIGAAAMKSIQENATAKNPHHIPLLFMQDVIHGYRTIYPIPLGLGCSFDPDMVYELARMTAKESAVSGVHVTFSPMADMVRDARWGRVMESTGEDKEVNCRMVDAFVRGYQGDDLKGKYDIAACVKHFAAYGAPEGGRDYNAVEMSDRHLRQTYLPAYKAAVDAGARMLMASFNTIGGVPSTGNKYLLGDILRGEWGFDGLVISDYDAYREMIVHGAYENEKEAAFAAFDAGCDIEMVSAHFYVYVEQLMAEGRVTMEQIDQAVLRVLQLKEDLGLFENPYRSADEEEEAKLHLCAEHRDLVRRAAEQSAVLLKNDGVLPFSDTVKKVAVVGPFADEHGILGEWVCAGRDEDSVTVLQGIQNLLPGADIVCEKGCSWDIFDTDTSGIDAAVAAAKDADVVVLCLGEHQQYSGEGNSRADLCLPFAQRELAKAVCAANPNTAVVLFSGRPLVLTELVEQAPAVLEMWQPGTEGGSAAANLLFGKVNPTGKLTMSFPWCVGQVPISYDRQNTGRPVPSAKKFPVTRYTSRYIDAPVDPLFAFGHGLSYTTYTYGELTVSGDTLTPDGKLTVSVDVTNSGDMAGKETVQLYIRDRVASAVRPIKELIDFGKVELAPGETKTVTFTVTEDKLRFWNRDMQYTSEAGAFDVMVGPNSETLQTARFELVK